MSKIGESVKTDDFKKEKHVPVIELPGALKAGEAAAITVSVGKEIAHPNTTEHFIGWISLYYKPAGSKFIYNLGRADFVAHGASTDGANSLVLNTEPYAVFKVKLDQPGELFATSYCNIHGLWESSVEVKF
ncbi:MAG: class II SORL domain-containing protein [Deltaproteobacteria bacterium]|nr:class II SORL domain-containing protein [Deltaproteobacteria bacterium]